MPSLLAPSRSRALLQLDFPHCSTLRLSYPHRDGLLTRAMKHVRSSISDAEDLKYAKRISLKFCQEFYNRLPRELRDIAYQYVSTEDSVCAERITYFPLDAC